MKSKVKYLTSWLPDVLTGLAKASGVGYLAAIYTLSRWLTRPSHGQPRLTPDHFGLTWQPLECQTEDAIRLAGWAISPERPKGTVLVCHGLRNNRAQTLGRIALLAAAGYRCIAFDHRAHGESGGRRTSFGYYEGNDVVAIRRHLQPVWPEQPWVALGLSMGAAAVCFAAQRTPPWAAVVLESLYHDLHSAFTNRIGTKYPQWFSRFASGVVWMTERRLKVPLKQIAPIEHVAGLASAPVLLLTGDADCLAPPEDSRRLRDRCSGPTDLWLVPGAGHEDVLEVSGGAYGERVLGFLNRHVRCDDNA